MPESFNRMPPGLKVLFDEPLSAGIVVDGPRKYPPANWLSVALKRHYVPALHRVFHINQGVERAMGKKLQAKELGRLHAPAGNVTSIKRAEPENAFGGAVGGGAAKVNAEPGSFQNDELKRRIRYLHGEVQAYENQEARERERRRDDLRDIRESHSIACAEAEGARRELSELNMAFHELSAANTVLGERLLGRDKEIAALRVELALRDRRISRLLAQAKALVAAAKRRRSR